MKISMLNKEFIFDNIIKKNYNIILYIQKN